MIYILSDAPRELKQMLLFLLGFLSFSCLNRYEKDVIGHYEVGKYELIDSTERHHDFPDLTLKRNKTFLLSFKDTTIRGRWNAFDSGDWTEIDLHINGKVVQGTIGTNNISINIPALIYCEFLKTLEFKKVNMQIAK